MIGLKVTPNFSRGPIPPKGARRVAQLSAWGPVSWGNVVISGVSLIFPTGVKLSWDRVIFAPLLSSLCLSPDHAPQLPTGGVACPTTILRVTDI